VIHVLIAASRDVLSLFPFVDYAITDVFFERLRELKPSVIIAALELEAKDDDFVAVVIVMAERPHLQQGESADVRARESDQQANSSASG
jgi:hypothetical protein